MIILANEFISMSGAIIPSLFTSLVGSVTRKCGSSNLRARTMFAALAAMAPLLLGACGADSRTVASIPAASSPVPAANTPPASSAAEVAITQLETKGALPKLERGPTLQGIDADGDGVRDDVMAYITQHFGHDPMQKAAAVQFGKAMQDAITADPANRAEVFRIQMRMDRALSCVFLRFPIGGPINPSRVGKEIESITTNTKLRLVAYLKHAKALHGYGSDLPENGCD